VSPDLDGGLANLPAGFSFDGSCMSLVVYALIRYDSAKVQFEDTQYVHNWSRLRAYSWV
jgi:hypothetical protein